MEAEGVDRGALAGTRYSGNAHPHRVAGVGEALLDYLLGNGLVFIQVAFDQRDRLAQNTRVAFDNAFDIFGGRERAAAGRAHLFQVGVDDRRLLDTFVNGKSCVLCVVLGMLHSYVQLRKLFK